MTRKTFNSGTYRLTDLFTLTFLAGATANAADAVELLFARVVFIMSARAIALGMRLFLIIIGSSVDLAISNVMRFVVTYTVYRCQLLST